MYPIFRTVLQSVTRCKSFSNTVNLFHSLGIQQTKAGNNLLVPTNLSLVPSCGFKVKGFLKRRCKDCFFAKKFDRLYVLCPTHPRHKQMQMAKKEKNTWILTHATQGKIRPW